MKICILGAGALGVMSAYELARRGHAVTVLERQAGPARECSFANGGQLSYSHAEPWANPGVFPKLWKWAFQEDAPLALRPRADIHMLHWGALFLLNCLPARARRHCEVLLRLGLYSREKMAELVADTNIEFSFLRAGELHIFDHAPSFEAAKRQNEFQKKLGCEGIPLTPAQCVEKEPALANSTKKLVGGMFAPIDERGDLYAFTVGLAQHCTEKYKVQFLYGQTIARLHQAEGRITHVEIEGQHRDYMQGFDAYVMCMGSYSSIYLRQLGLYVPIYPMKGYSITFDASEPCPTLSITDDAAKQVYTRLGDRMRVAGTAEFSGYHDAVRQVRIDMLTRGVKALFPGMPMENLTPWACLRPSTPDGPPIIGKTPLSNLYMNTGHGTLGWTQGAGSARLLADVMEGKPTDIPLTGLEIERNLLRF